MIYLFVIMIIYTTILSAKDPTIVKKAVYDLTTGNVEVVESKLVYNIISNIKYYKSKEQALKVRVIVHRDAYKFFMDDLNDTAYEFEPILLNHKKALHKALQQLVKEYHVEFWVCSAGMRYRNLKKEAFYPFVTMVHNAMVGLIDSQNDGYAYVPIDK